MVYACRELEECELYYARNSDVVIWFIAVTYQICTYDLEKKKQT
jgi:hypothetical protein